MTERESRSLIMSYAPTFLVALSFCTFLLVQIMGYGIGTKAESENLKRLNSIADSQIAMLNEHHRKIEQSIKELKPYVVRAEAEQKRFTDLMRDVDALARAGDRDAQSVLWPVCNMKVKSE
jgi:N-acetylglucosamine kinase-like BadF-type ATPase